VTTLLALLACTSEDIPTDSTASTGLPSAEDPGTTPVPTTPTGGTGTPEPEPDREAPFGTVTVHFTKDLAPEAQLRLMISAADGTFLETIVPDRDPMVLEDVPRDAYISQVWYAARDFSVLGTPDAPVLVIDTRGGVRNGDEHYFTGSVHNSFHPVGEAYVTLPAIGLEGRRFVVTPCGEQQASDPTVLLLDLTTACTASGMFDAEAAIRHDNGVRAVSFLTGIPVTGTAPDRWAKLDFGPWILDPGRVEVTYANTTAETQEGVTLIGAGTRNRHVYGALTGTQSAPRWLSPSEPLSIAMPVDDAFHHDAWIELAVGADQRDRPSTVLHEALAGAVPRRQVRSVFRDASHLARRIDAGAWTIDTAGRAASLPLPADWSCRGRSANVLAARLTRSVPEGQDVSWGYRGPHAETLELPQLDPDLDADLSQSLFRMTVGVWSVEGGYEQLASLPRIGDLPFTWLRGFPPGSFQCGAQLRGATK